MTASTIHRALKKERESWTDEQARLVGEQQKLASERDQAIAEANRLLANNSDVSSEQSEWSRQRQSLMAERDQLVAERQAQRTEIEKVRESVNTHIYKGDMYIDFYLAPSCFISLPQQTTSDTWRVFTGAHVWLYVHVRWYRRGTACSRVWQSCRDRGKT